jgi:hypothetical protein
MDVGVLLSPVRYRRESITGPYVTVPPDVVVVLSVRIVKFNDLGNDSGCLSVLDPDRQLL